MNKLVLTSGATNAPNNDRDAARHVSTTRAMTRRFIPLLWTWVFIPLLFLSCITIKPLFSTCENKSDPASKLYAELVLSATPNTLAKKEKKAGWQLLFDGKTADGWRGYNMQKAPDVWTIEDGCLVMNSEGGNERQDIMTDGVYRDFAFTVEYKMSKGSNSGIIYQIKEDPKYQRPHFTGPEIQLIDHDNFPVELAGWQINGAIVGMYAPKAKPHHPFGEWNHLLLVVKGNHVTIMLNGVEIIRYEKYSEEWNELYNIGRMSRFPDFAKFDEGHISLQYYGSGNLWFRNIKIKLL